MELSREFSTNTGEREQVLLFLNAYEETSTQQDTDDVKNLNTLHRCILKPQIPNYLDLLMEIC